MSMLGARYYDPVVGRFVSPDPISFAGGLNLYAYCGGDPVNAVDPSGLDPGTVVGIAQNPLEQQGIRDGAEWIRTHPNESARFVLGLADIFSVVDIVEAATGQEVFTHRPLTKSEQAITGVMILLPEFPTQWGRGATRFLARTSKTACEAMQALQPYGKGFDTTFI
jgi:uncharacterized protein RhaS with RHS repeats